MKPPRYRVVAGGRWEFVGALLPNGYGKAGREGRTWLAHRLAWAVWRGGIPEGACVLHRCDNRKCVNADHLFLGDRFDNMQDMISKDRANFVGFQSPNFRRPAPRKGSLNGRAKLTESQVRLILSQEGRRHCDVAAEFGVSTATVQRIFAKANWKHVTP